MPSLHQLQQEADRRFDHSMYVQLSLRDGGNGRLETFWRLASGVWRLDLVWYLISGVWYISKPEASLKCRTGDVIIVCCGI